MRWTVRRLTPKEGWVNFFAWHPVVIGNTGVWLETVQRRLVHVGGGTFDYEYRFKPIKPGE